MVHMMLACPRGRGLRPLLTFRQSEEVVGLLAVGRGLEVLVPEASGDDDVDAMPSGSLHEEAVLAILSGRDGLVLAQLPTLAAGHSSHIANALMRVIAWRLVDAVNTEISHMLMIA
jgi:hypothetical protein